MPITIKSQHIKHARKQHQCDYCGEEIEKGSPYSYSFLKDGGETYSWKTHEDCDFVATELWEYINPWDGMTTDEFISGVNDFYREFVCAECKHKELCSLQSYDDCPCGIDGCDTKRQVEHIKPILDEFSVVYHPWTREEPYGKSILVKKVTDE